MDWKGGSETSTIGMRKEEKDSDRKKGKKANATTDGAKEVPKQEHG